MALQEAVTLVRDVADPEQAAKKVTEVSKTDCPSSYYRTVSFTACTFGEIQLVLAVDSLPGTPRNVAVGRLCPHSCSSSQMEA